MRPIKLKPLTKVAMVSTVAVGGVFIAQLSSGAATTTYTAPCTDTANWCQNQRLGSLESAVSSLQNRVASLENRGTSTPPTTAPPTTAPPTTAPPTTSAAPTPTRPPTTPPPSTSAAPTPTPTPATIPGGYPDATNTGPAAAGYRSFTAHAGGWHITTPGVYSGYDVSGEVYIDVAGVTLQGFKIHGGSANRELVLVRAGNAIIQDSEIHGESNTTAGAPTNGIENYGDGLIVRRNNIYNLNSDGIRLAESRNDTIQDNYMHDWVASPTDSPHLDGIVPGESTAGPWTITHNTILMWSPGHMTSVLSFEGVPGKVVGPMKVDNNILAGGGYTISGGGDTNYTGITFTNNRFSTKFSSNVGVYGIMTQSPRWGTSGSLWGGTGQQNVWHDGPNAGKVITAP
jgi:hypothetical protein